jgi:uncharacterized DUF497 family protein
LSLPFCSYNQRIFVRRTWSVAKDRQNRRKHRLSFDTAQLMFSDPQAMSRPDPYPQEERWQTVGVVGQVTVFVVHTWSEGGEEAGRIISARKATPHKEGL